MIYYESMDGTIWPICAESAVKPQPTYESMEISVNSYFG